MGHKILLLGHEKVAGLTLAAMAIQLDLEPLLVDWGSFQPRAFGRRNRPGLVVVDADKLPGISMESLCLVLRKQFGENVPILAATASRKFQDAARLLDAGATDCLPRMPSEEIFARKIVRCLAGGTVATACPPEEEEPLPAALVQAFAGGNGWRTLGDCAGIYGGAAPRRPAFRRMAPPDAGWRGVLLADDIDKFSVGKPGMYLRWSRLHLFRLPDPSEYAVREKVVLRRAGPPLAAAVDRSRNPVGPDVYALIPSDGVPAGFLACLLNSRLADFYFNRMIQAGAEQGRLRVDLLRRFPVPPVDAETMTDLSRSAGLLAHFGVNPQSWIDRQRRDELLERMDETVFSLYGVDHGARRELAALHF